MMRFVIVSMIAVSLSGAAFAQKAKPAPGGRSSTGGVLGIGASKAPISIDADKLQVFDKEQRAVYTGNVVVVQGETTMKAAHMTVFYERNNQEAQATENAGGGPGGAALKRVEAKGDVILTGNVSLSQGENITKGERLFYNLSSGIATVEGGRVRSLLIPGSEDPGTKAAPAKPAGSAPQQKPKP